MLKRPSVLVCALMALALLLASCANRVTTPGLRNDLIVQMLVSGQISTNPAVRYIFVMNASGVGQGPKLFGPWLPVAPQIGWDLPFYVGSNNPDGANEVSLLSAQSPPVVIEPNTWTDAFILSNVAGTEQVAHMVRTNSATGDMKAIAAANPPTLTQGVDWMLTSSQGASGPQDTWQLNLPMATYGLNNLTSLTLNANFVIQAIPPSNASFGQYNSYIGPNGWIIDQWNQAPNVPVSLSLDPSQGIVSQTSPHAGTPVYGANLQLVQGLNPPDVTLKGYTSQVKAF